MSSNEAQFQFYGQRLTQENDFRSSRVVYLFPVKTENELVASMALANPRVAPAIARMLASKPFFT